MGLVTGCNRGPDRERHHSGSRQIRRRPENTCLVASRRRYIHLPVNDNSFHALQSGVWSQM